MKRTVFCLLFLLFSTTSLFAQHHSDSTRIHRSEYAGQEMRVIKSLSPDDLTQLQNGDGWGLAKAAELNGYPGPRHLLDMADEISLSKEQQNEIEMIFTEMKENAIQKGEMYIAAEKKLNEAFASRDIAPASLNKLLMEVSTAQQELRYIHLAAHLETTKLLTEEQIRNYNELRGYSSIKDPCQNIPAGHDAAMWKKHNNCEQ